MTKGICPTGNAEFQDTGWWSIKKDDSYAITFHVELQLKLSHLSVQCYSQTPSIHPRYGCVTKFCCSSIKSAYWCHLGVQTSVTWKKKLEGSAISRFEFSGKNLFSLEKSRISLASASFFYRLASVWLFHHRRIQPSIARNTEKSNKKCSWWWAGWQAAIEQQRSRCFPIHSTEWSGW